MLRHSAVPSLALLLAALPASAGDANMRSLEAIRQRGVLRVLAVIVDAKPEFVSVQPGRPPGFDLEVLGGFARQQRLSLELVRVAAWVDLMPALLEGRGDVIAGRFTHTESRRRQIDFTVEVFPSRSVAVTRHPHRIVTTLEELRAEKIGVVKGTSMVDLVRAAGVPAGNVDDGFPVGGVPGALYSGRVTCVIDELASAILARRRDPGLQLGMLVGPPAGYAYGVRKEDRELRDALDSYIHNLARTSSWDQLVIKYFGADALEILRRASAP